MLCRVVHLKGWENRYACKIELNEEKLSLIRNQNWLSAVATVYTSYEKKNYFADFEAKSMLQRFKFGVTTEDI
jgi:hypothetical protein